MKRVLVLAGLTLGAAAIAQTPPDVPENHWASKAVTDLYRLGILRGYPDGLYRGTRPVTRYEMARAINAMVGGQEKSVIAMMEDFEGFLRDQGRKSQESIKGLAEIRRRLDSLEANVNDLQALRTETRAVTSQYESLLEQLRKLQQDVRNMRIKRQ